MRGAKISGRHRHKENLPQCAGSSQQSPTKYVHDKDCVQSRKLEKASLSDTGQEEGSGQYCPPAHKSIMPSLALPSPKNKSLKGLGVDQRILSPTGHM